MNEDKASMDLQNARKSSGVLPMPGNAFGPSLATLSPFY
jgi:hypothetical protein